MSNTEDNNTRGQKLSLVLTLFLGVIISYFAQILLTSLIKISGIGVFMARGENIAYFLKWLINDIIVYTPSLLVFGSLLKSFTPDKAFDKENDIPLIKKILITLLFLIGVRAAAIIVERLTQLVASIMTDMFGTKPLVDVFENIMPTNNTQWAIMLLFVGIIAPIMEEIIFRRIILIPLRGFGDKWAVIISSVMFGLSHGNASQFFYATAAGILLGIVTIKTNSIKPAITIHILNNVLDFITI